jgi:imidazolonepropionase-like amidohydrolase
VRLLCEELGFSEFEAIQIATLNGARALELTAEPEASPRASKPI